MSALFFIPFFLISSSSRAQEIIHFQAANTSILRDVKNALHFANFVKHEFKYLKVTPFMSLLVPNKKKCQVWCVKDFQCLSFNLGVFPISGGKLKCDLLATDMFNSSMNMTDNINYHHYAIKTGCYPMSCKNNGTCQPDYKTNTYSCHCQCPYYGHNCEKAGIKTWSTWSNCSFSETCPEFTRKRTKMYPTSSQCPVLNNGADDKETQMCNISSTGCDNPVGMQDGRIQNSQITASSSWVVPPLPFFAPWLARLHQVENNNAGCWTSGVKRVGEYLQIDLGTVMTITKVATQGRPSTVETQYVNKYSLQYSTDNTEWKDYENPQCIKVFPGNTDTNTVVTNALEVPIKTRYFRIVVKDFYGHPSMRAELYGCQD